MNSLDLLLSLASWCVKSAVMVSIAWCLSLCFTKHAAARRIVWILAFLGIALLPLFGLLPSQESAVVVVDLPQRMVEAPTALGVTGWLLVFWAAVTGVLLINAAAAHIALYRVTKRASTWEAADVEEIVSRAGLSATPKILLDDRITVALAWGWRRPVIVLPSDATEWPAQRLNEVLLHELSHLRKGDSIFQLLAQLTCALLWPQPAVWLAAAALRADSEAAADDAVLAQGVQPSTYASTLLAAASQMSGARPAAAVPFIRKGQLERRIRSIVSPKRTRRGASLAQCIAALTLTLVACGGLALCKTAWAQPTASIPAAMSSKSKEFWEGYWAGQRFMRDRQNGSLSLSANEKMQIEREAQRRMAAGGSVPFFGSSGGFIPPN